MAECPYCGWELSDETGRQTIRSDDEFEWDLVASQHDPGCEWILLRGRASKGMQSFDIHADYRAWLKARRGNASGDEQD